MRAISILGTLIIQYNYHRCMVIVDVSIWKSFFKFKITSTHISYLRVVVDNATQNLFINVPQHRIVVII